uniref:Uncharacterized protein n=1 Tax=Anguilla anguilla TaxID=7936 RepID=A0A0E9TPC8_ANGAN
MLFMQTCTYFPLNLCLKLITVYMFLALLFCRFKCFKLLLIVPSVLFFHKQYFKI